MALAKNLLFMACESNNLELIKECLASGYNINERNLCGQTPLMRLIETNFETCLNSVKHLVENGADINIKDYDGKNALSTENKTNSVLDYLEENSDKYIDNRISNDNDEAISTFQLQIQTDEKLFASATKEFINTFDSRGFSPFMWTIWYKNLNYFDYYILMGADVNLPNRNGVTPLMIACFKFDMNIVKQLLAKGASLNESDAAGNSVIAYFMNSNNECTHENLKYLLDAGADINSCGRNGKTLLIWASILRISKFVDVPETSTSQSIAANVKYPIWTHTNARRTGLGFQNQTSKINNIEKKPSKSILTTKEIERLNVNKCDNEGNTALGYLAYHNEQETITTLISLKKSVMAIDVCGKNGRTPLAWAITGNHFDLFKFLLENGAKLNHIDFQGNTPLSYARRYNRRVMIDYLLKKGAIDPHEHPLILTAMKSNNIKRFQNLLDLCNTFSEIETTHLLYMAINESNFDYVEFLNQNCNINWYEKKKNGTTPLIYAIYLENIEMIKYLLENGAKPTVHSAFRTALEMENLEIIKLLIDNGAKVNKTYGEAGTPLLQAINMKNEEILKLLLASGASPNSNENPSLLVTAINLKYFTFAKHLIENGAEVDENSLKKLSPLQTACKLQQFDIIQLLVENKATINSNEFPSPLRTAILLNNLEISKFLIENGANVCEILEDEKTLLQLAVDSKNIELVKLLIGKNSEVLKIKNKYSSPLKRAIEMNHSLLVDYLIKQGADVDEIDVNTKENLLDLAIKNENIAILIQLILQEADLESSRKKLEEFAETDTDFEEFFKDFNDKVSLKEIERNLAEMKKKLARTINNQ